MSKKSLRNTFCSIILLVTISFSLCGNTFATAFDPQYVFEKQFHSEQKAIDEQYDKHMFSFNEPSSIVTSKLLTDQSYEATVDFISSLDLSNYPDVKEANLRYIEQLHKRGCVIRTYTVFTPKSSAQTLRLGDDLLYYGSYHGRDYHTREYGESTYDIAKNTETSTQRLNYFINGALDVFVGLAGSVVSYPYSTIRSIVGMPQNFTVNSGDKMESYIRVHATFKGIYTQDSNQLFGGNASAIVRVMTIEAGSARPYFLYRFGSTSTTNPTYSGWLANATYVSTRLYYDKTAVMEQAENNYLNRIDYHYTLVNEVLRNAATYLA